MKQCHMWVCGASRKLYQKLAPEGKYSKDDIYALAEYAQFNTCLTCTNKDGPCELRHILEKLGIKPTNAKGCPYDVWGDAIEQ